MATLKRSSSMNGHESSSSLLNDKTNPNVDLIMMISRFISYISRFKVGKERTKMPLTDKPPQLSQSLFWLEGGLVSMSKRYMCVEQKVVF